MPDDDALQRETQKRVANAIRQAMAQHGLTQAEVARRANVPQPRISSLLAGSRGKYPAELLRVLDAIGLRLTTEHLDRTDDVDDADPAKE